MNFVDFDDGLVNKFFKTGGGGVRGGSSTFPEPQQKPNEVFFSFLFPFNISASHNIAPHCEHLYI